MPRSSSRSRLSLNGSGEIVGVGDSGLAAENCALADCEHDMGLSSADVAAITAGWESVMERAQQRAEVDGGAAEVVVGQQVRVVALELQRRRQQLLEDINMSRFTRAAERETVTYDHRFDQWSFACRRASRVRKRVHA